MQREDQSRDQSRLAFRTKMGIHFKVVKGIMHEMIQQAKLAYDQGYVHMWDHLIHDCTCTYMIEVVTAAINNYYTIK